MIGKTPPVSSKLENAEGVVLTMSSIPYTSLISIALLISGFQTPTQQVQSAQKPALRAKLLQRVKADQAIRNEMIQKGADHPDQSILARMEVIDSANTKLMKGIIRQYGWPSQKLVGHDGTEAAFLLVQHGDLVLQKEAMPSVKKAYEAGELSGQDYALLLDRVLVTEGKPQVYGTQAKRFDQWNGREPVFEPIEDEANVDKRRAEVGLFPMSEYRKLLQQMLERASPTDGLEQLEHGPTDDPARIGVEGALQCVSEGLKRPARHDDRGRGHRRQRGGHGGPACEGTHIEGRDEDVGVGLAEGGHQSASRVGRPSVSLGLVRPGLWSGCIHVRYAYA